MNPTTYIKRQKPLCLLHPWDRRTIARKLHRRATLLLRVGCAMVFTSCVAFVADAPLWACQASLALVIVAAPILGRAWFLASKAGKYDI